MKKKWLIVPDINRLDESLEISRKYNASFEYDDFSESEVYQSKDEIERRVRIYKSLDRDRSLDTLHGVFKDIAFISDDDVIRNRSRELMEQSMNIAVSLQIRGVVFHTGLISNLLSQKKYADYSVTAMAEYFSYLADKYPQISIYIENSFEPNPTSLLALMDRLAGKKNVRICLDYAHASISGVNTDMWVKALSSYIGHVHINDNDLAADLHLEAGKGKIDFKRMFEQFEANSVDVPMLIEISDIDAAEKSLEYLNLI